MNTEISAEVGSLRVRKLNHLSPTLATWVRRFYKLESDKLTFVPDLPIASNTVLEGWNLSSIARVNVVQVFSKMEDMEESNRIVKEVTSWFNWWLVAMQGLANSTKPEDVVKVHCLFIAGG